MTRAIVFAVVLVMPAISAKAGADCVRHVPVPVFPKKVATMRSTAFHPVSGNEANEEVVFATGERLKIRNWGCESFVMTFRYESKTLPASGDGRAWYERAAEVLERISRLEPQTPFDLPLAARQLRKALRTPAALRLEEDIEVEGDGVEFLQTRVSVKGGGALEGGGGGYVEFQLAKGPL
jgi:hypothetical protein